MQLDIFAGKNIRKQNWGLEETFDGFSFTFLDYPFAFWTLNPVLKFESIGFKELDYCRVLGTMPESKQNKRIRLLHKFTYHWHSQLGSKRCLKGHSRIIRHRPGHCASHKLISILWPILVNFRRQLPKAVRVTWIIVIWVCDQDEIRTKPDRVNSHLYCEHLLGTSGLGLKL